MAYQTLKLDDFKDDSRPLDAEFLEVIDHLPPLSRKGPWLAGGSVRKYMNGIQNTADYDIFFYSQDQCDAYCNDLITHGAVETSDNIFNRTFKLQGRWDIQCIHHEFRSTLIQTMDRFDITICQFGFDGTNLVWSDEAGEDARAMTFHFLQTTDPVYNFNRAFKYAREGYKPADGEVKKVLRRVARLPESIKNNREISTNPVDQTITVSMGAARSGKTAQLIRDLAAQSTLYATSIP